MSKLLDYCKKHQRIYIPRLIEYLGEPTETVLNAIIDLKDIYPAMRMYEKTLVLNPDNIPTWYEITDTKYNRGKFIHKEHLSTYFDINQTLDQHISVYAHDESWIENVKETGKVSCQDTQVATDYIYLEIDRPTIKEAKENVISFLQEKEQYLDYITVFYSGNRGYHIMIDAQLFGSPYGKQENITGHGKLIYNIAHKFAGDFRNKIKVVDPWLMNINDLFKAYYKNTGKILHRNADDVQLARQGLESIDPNLYRVNSLIRQPFSFHEKTGNQKLLCEFTGKDLIILYDKKTFDIKQKKPYLIDYVYECFESKIPKKTYDISVDADIIIQTFSQLFDYFDPSEANEDGWVNYLYSPFYHDTNPSVSVNIITGYYMDFGSPVDRYSFVELFAKVNKISHAEARKILNE